MELLTTVCVVLAMVYLLLGAMAAIQLLSILRTTADYAWGSPRHQLLSLDSPRERSGAPGSIGNLVQAFRPWTTQKVLHVLIFLLAVARVAWLTVASLAWDADTGSLKASVGGAYRLSFYVLDEGPAALTFAVFALLALVWVELYYTSAEEPGLYAKFARPAHRAANVLCAAGWGAAPVLYGTAWRGFDEYIATEAALFFAGSYVAVAAVFALYAYSVTLQLRVVPIELQTRKHRVDEVSWMTAGCVSCLLVRAGVLAWAAGEVHTVATYTDALLVLLYFAALEALPLALVLLSHGRTPLPPRKKLAPEETRLLFGPAGEDPSVATGGGRSGARAEEEKGVGEVKGVGDVQVPITL